MIRLESGQTPLFYPFSRASEHLENSELRYVLKVVMFQGFDGGLALSAEAQSSQELAIVDHEPDRPSRDV